MWLFCYPQGNFIEFRLLTWAMALTISRILDSIMPFRLGGMTPLTPTLLRRSCKSEIILSFFFRRSFNASFWVFQPSISSISFIFSSCVCKCWKSSDLKFFLVRLNASEDRLEDGNEAELPLKNWILSLTGDVDVFNTEKMMNFCTKVNILNGLELVDPKKFRIWATSVENHMLKFSRICRHVKKNSFEYFYSFIIFPLPVVPKLFLEFKINASDSLSDWLKFYIRGRHLSINMKPAHSQFTFLKSIVLFGTLYNQ